MGRQQRYRAAPFSSFVHAPYSIYCDWRRTLMRYQRCGDGRVQNKHNSWMTELLSNTEKKAALEVPTIAHPGHFLQFPWNFLWSTRTNFFFGCSLKGGRSRSEGLSLMVHFPELCRWAQEQLSGAVCRSDCCSDDKPLSCPKGQSESTRLRNNPQRQSNRRSWRQDGVPNNEKSQWSASRTRIHRGALGGGRNTDRMPDYRWVSRICWKWIFHYHTEISVWCEDDWQDFMVTKDSRVDLGIQECADDCVDYV